MTTPDQDPDLPVWQPSVEPEGHAADVAAPAAVEGDGAPAPQPPSSARATVHVPNRQRRANSSTALLIVAGLIAVGGVGFAIGHVTGGSASTTQAGAGGNANGQFGPGGSFQPNGSFRPDGSFAPGDGGGRNGAVIGGSSLVTGTVTAITSDSMTIQLSSGQTITVALDSSTSFHSQTSSSSSAVATGSTVIVKTTTGASASASPGTGGDDSTRTATDVTVTSGS